MLQTENVNRMAQFDNALTSEGGQPVQFDQVELFSESRQLLGYDCEQDKELLCEKRHEHCNAYILLLELISTELGIEVEIWTSRLRCHIPEMP